ncbi:MAG: hypothetical protein U0R80_07435 [Nocardioidaceae bacterium]
MRSRPAAAALLIVLVALTGCSQQDTQVPADRVVDDTVTLRVTATTSTGGPIYTEGAVQVYRLTDSAGHDIEPTSTTKMGVTWEGLEPGSYGFAAAQRPCDANCGNLDPPVDGCDQTIDLTEDVDLSLTFAVGEPCSIARGPH